MILNEQLPSSVDLEKNSLHMMTDYKSQHVKPFRICLFRLYKIANIYFDINTGHKSQKYFWTWISANPNPNPCRTARTSYFIL